MGFEEQISFFIIYLEVKHLREDKVRRQNNLECVYSR